MIEIVSSVIACVLLFVAMVLLDRLGEWLRRRSDLSDTTSVSATAVFALLGLMLAFTYSAAHARLEDRRNLIVRETNAIGTAYLRVDLLPPAVQPPMRQLFREYTQSRVDAYYTTNDAELTAAYANAGRLQADIWRQATTATDSEAGRTTRLVVIPALNDMFDQATARRAATAAHHPVLVVVLVFVVALVAALLSGYSVSGDRVRHRVETIAFAAVVSFSVYLILDLDYPRYGLVRLDDINAVLEQTLASMK